MPADLSSNDVAVGNAGCESRLDKDKAAALAAYDAARPLFNDTVVRGRAGDPLLDREQPHHRIMVFLRAEGYTNVEIAELTGYSPVTVGYVLRQPWARQLLLQLINQRGDDGVDKLLRSELVPSIIKLAELRDSDNAPANTQLAAANSLIDRWLGKPVQRVETSKAPTVESVEAAQVELARLREEESRLKAN